MTHYVVRRRRLGRTSCREIQRQSTQGIVAVRNDRMPDRFDGYVFRWGCTSTLPNHEGATIVNEASAIHWASDKRYSRLDMQAKGISVPYSTGWTHQDTENWWEGNEFLEQTPEEMTQKWVARKPRHAQGRDLFVGCFNDCVATLGNWGEGGYIAKLIDKVAEYRVFVVSGRVTCVASKTPVDPSAVAWNVAQGGSFDNVRWDNWPLAACLEAVKAAELSGLDFCGVDVMMDKDGKPYILEINSAPSLTSPYRQKCMAKAFDYIISNGKERMLLTPGGGWRMLIHPAIWSPS